MVCGPSISSLQLGSQCIAGEKLLNVGVSISIKVRYALTIQHISSVKCFSYTYIITFLESDICRLYTYHLEAGVVGLQCIKCKFIKNIFKLTFCLFKSLKQKLESLGKKESFKHIFRKLC